MNERILCLDVGDVRIGVAVSDETRLIATPVEVIHRVGWGPDVKRVKQLCAEYDTELVLSGLPLNMDGTAGFQTEKVKKFCEQLEKAGLTVYYQDERLTTVTAEEALLEDNMSRADRKQHVDKVAAAVILQQYLDSLRETEQKEGKTMSEMNEEMESNIIEMIDENGDTVEFEYITTVEHEGGEYLILTEAGEDDEDDEDAEVVIMKIEQDDDGNDIYVAVEDEDLETAVFEKFLAMMDEEDDTDGE